MEEDFYKERLIGRHGLEVMIPSEHERQTANEIVFGELCRGEMTQSSRQELSGIMRNLATHGAEGIILGCTEFGLLVDPKDVPVPVFDTTTIHAKSAAMFALEQ